MLLDGFDYILEKIPYFAQSVAYGNSLDWAGEAGGEESGPVGDWGAREP